MTNEITLNSSAEAHTLAKEIARHARISVAIKRHDNFYIVYAKPGIDISHYANAIDEKKLAKNTINLVNSELQVIKDQLNDATNKFQNKFKLIKDEIKNLFASSLIKICLACNGNGRYVTKCGSCNGEGVKKTEKMNFNLCKACGGDGGISGNCYSCGGTGYKEDISYSPCQLCNGVGAEACCECNQVGFIGDPKLISFAKKLCEIIGLNMKDISKLPDDK
jgi:hypothetical protein